MGEYEDLCVKQLEDSERIIDRLQRERDAARAECAQSRRPTMQYHRDQSTGLTKWAWHDAAMILLEKARAEHDTLCPNWHTPTTGGQGEGGKHEQH